MKLFTSYVLTSVKHAYIWQILVCDVMVLGSMLLNCKVHRKFWSFPDPKNKATTKTQTQSSPLNTFKKNT